jgi:putative DNA primase/helicase
MTTANDGGSAEIRQAAPNLRVVKLPGAKEPAPPRDADPAPVHFRALGHNRDQVYFMTARGRQLLRVPISALAAKTTLLHLAPLQWWEREFPAQGGFKGAAVDQAVDFLIGQCFRRGVFRPDQVRGRGAWWDDGRLAIHAGDRLIVDGAPCALEEISGRYVYEARPPIPIDLDDPLPVEEAEKLHRYCRSLCWEQGQISATLFAGWVAASIGCGALEWRPHIFLTGPSGCGKTTVLKTVLALLGEFALSVKGDTSAPGVRQALGPDALPVIFDEAEAESIHAEDNLNRVLALMRSASADSESRVVKGGQGGEATGYALRSMFCLTAIRVGLKQTADHTRVTVLELGKPGAAAREAYLATVAPLAAEIADPMWAARFRARVLLRLGDLRANARTFGLAAGLHLGSARLGDQIGPLLAGAYLLHRDGLVSPQAAGEWVARQRWTEQEEIAQERDEARLLAALLESQVSLQVDRVRYDASIGELVGIASGRLYHRSISAKEAAGELGRRGMLVSTTHVCISNTHRAIEAALRGTSWTAGWSRVLRRIEGARAHGREWYGGAQSRGTAVPLDAVLRPVEPPAGATPAADGPVWGG